MPEIKQIFIDGSLHEIIDNDTPIFSWSVLSYDKDAYQASFNLSIFNLSLPIGYFTPLWNVRKETKEQSIKYDGPTLESGERYMLMLDIKDNRGKTSKPFSKTFIQGKIDWDAEWIAAEEDIPLRTVEYTKEFDIDVNIKKSTLFVCGIGYHKVFINGEELRGGVLSPSFSNYKKVCYYEVLPVEEKILRMGKNDISVVVAEGWRRNLNVIGKAGDFTGTPQLTAMFKIDCTDGSVKWIKTDGTWLWNHTPIKEASIFNGIVFDERIKKEPGRNVIIKESPGGVMHADCLEPVLNKGTLMPLSIFSPEENVFIADFGQNIAGYVSVKLPGHMEEGDTVTVIHAEVLDEDGKLYTAPLRDATQTDIFISAGGMYENQWFFPLFTYHGFRYVQVTGVESLSKDDIYALEIHNDMNTSGSFICVNPTLYKIHKNSVMTEKANMHGILTDCPQRNERMGWMNDATVRFEAVPYNFYIGRMYPKIIRDIINEQTDGMITCTAPFVYGGRPADPVCSSFLVAGLYSYLFNGNTDIIKEAYEPYKAWENYLLSRSDNYIVNYSYYGDWASPSYSCMSDEFAVSNVTPGVLMSTGYSYYNCILLKRFAEILQLENDVKYYDETAKKIQKAFLDKWFDVNTCKVATGSQACQAFSLWLGILPEEYRSEAALLLHNDLTEKNFMFTTGNLCTRYMCDVLSEYGYVDDVYELLTKDTYPSIGYEIQNEATTIWERFELKKNPGMNSHNHPMYGSVDYWFYAYLCGIKPLDKAFDTVDIHPHFPSKLLHAHCSVETVKGDIVVKWTKKYSNTHVYLTIPFGVKASVHLPDRETFTVGSGCYYFKV